MRYSPRALVEQMAWQNRLARTYAAVCFLQCDHIGMELAEHRHNPLGIAPPIHTHGLVDVVAGETKLQRKSRSVFMNRSN
jgi:hypothetical protein